MEYTFYKISHPTNSYVYVGCTRNFTRRKFEHKNNCITKGYKIYTTIQEHGGWTEWTMSPIEIGVYESKRLAECRETELIKEQEHRLNSIVSVRTEDEKKENEKQYYIENKEVIAEKKKQYYIEHREEQLKKQKQYYIEHREKSKQTYTCECGSILTNDSKSRHMKSLKHQKLISIHTI